MKEIDRIYRLIDAHSVSSVPNELVLHHSDHCTLLITTKGIGEGDWNGQPFILPPSHALLLSPKMSWTLRGRGLAPFEYERISFDVYIEGSDSTLHRQMTEPSLQQAVSIPEVPQLAKEISTAWRAGNRWERMEANIRFQELLLLVLRHAEAEPELLHNHVRELMQRSKAHIDAAFHHSLTREVLAAKAGMSVAHYSRLFKREFGRGPMEYLNEVRLSQASNLLIGSEHTIRETAHRVGYQDEFYFSRKFKAATGASPTVFINKYRNSARVASVAIPYTSHLLALGMQPYAAMVNPSQEPLAELRDTLEVGNDQPDLDRLLQARPELIIGFERTDYEEPDKADLFRHIAPTCTVPFHGEWRDHLRMIGRAVNRTEAADLWLEQYETSAERSRNAIQHQIEDQTVAVAQFENGRFQLFGSRNLGTVLYRDLGFAMPRELANVSHSQMLTIEELAAYNIDHLILFTGEEHQKREAFKHSIESNAAWRELKAARSGHIYDLGASRSYSCYTSLSHALFLRRATELFMSQTSMQ
ncbi:AraC family transcriptional regulator [Paenibacillus sp. Leaf72]|uniref:AraC family transcriptional regulator n=1 Tax=Paenibacillus sp. Leaf72 TaxID=1736234 RepID=UPI00138F3C46|nr:AraC family transcriptional regulator [Paenibacillus sp. Leaf72]